MSTLIPDLTKIPAPRTPLIDERTGLMSREWYRFFYNLFNLAGSGGNFTSLTDLQKGPPSVPFEALQVDPNAPTNAPTDSPLVSQVDEIDKQINALESQPECPCEEYNAETQKEIDGLELLPRAELGTMAALQQANVPWLTFDTTASGVPPDVGTVAWDGGTTLGIQMTPNVLLKVGEAEYIYARASSAITKGQVCYHTGAVGSSGVTTVAPAPINLTDPNQIVGIAAESIALNDFGLIQISGDIKGFDTTGSSVGETWADGDPLYYNPAFVGSMTNTKPVAPNQKTYMGEVINAGSGGSGSMHVRIVQGSVLGGTDSNVQFGTVNNGDLIQYDSVLQYWKNVAPSSISIGTATNLAGGLAGSVPYQTAPGTTTFLNIGTALQVLKVNAGATAPEWVSGAALTKVDDTNVTLTLGGTPATSLLAATSLTLGWSGQLAVSRGGTGIASGTSGGIPYFSSTTTIASSAALASNALVVGGGAGVAPSTITTGTGVVTALGVNTGTAGAFVVNGGALGTPSSGTVTNLTGTASININGTVGATTPNTGAFTTLSASGVATFSAGTAALPAITTTGNTNTGIYFPTADTIAFTEGGSEAARIDSSGNVTIGETNAQGYRLNVKVSGSSTTRLANDVLRLASNGSGADVNINFTDGVANNSYIGMVSGRLYFDTAGSERMSIDSAGNVAIGVVTPTSPLQVIGGVIKSGLVNSANTANIGGLTMYASTDAAGRRNWAIRPESTAQGTLGIWVSSANNTEPLSGTQVVSVNSSGNLGIGTTSPGARLDITSPAAFTARFSGPANTYIDVTDGTGTFRAQVISGEPTLSAVGAYPIKFITNSSERVRITSAGNVGVGTAAPVNKLQVAGSFGRGAPVTKTGNFTLADTENWVICNGTGTITVTLPAASSWTGREFTIKTIAAFTVISNTTNVVPLAGGAAGTAILAATAGTWATLVSDGANWIIMQA